MNWEIRQGDCVELMKVMEPETFHAIVTDPPYELGFMGKKWDDTGVAFRAETWAECLRVAKPGAHLLAFGGTRTFHRLACAIEDAGWEIRDCLMWIYGSGFPKSLDVSKAIDKAAGAERERYERPAFGGTFSDDNGATYGTAIVNQPATPQAQEWQGFGTALKPAYEPIILARKPLEGTVAQNVLKHGCGALDIDGSRTGYVSDADKGSATPGGRVTVAGRGNVPNIDGRERYEIERPEQKGRWPSNVLLDQESARLLDEQSGNVGGGFGKRGAVENIGCEQGMFGMRGTGEDVGFGDAGGASRFFYTSKAPQGERPEVDGVQHPTVKPLDLMRYLVGLVSREGDMVLEPFAGSGTTIAACVGLGRNVVGCELNPEYVKLVERRMETVTPSLFGGE